MIKIFGHKVEVYYNSKLASDHSKMGLSHADMNRLIIDNSFPHSQQEEVFIHEVLEHIIALLELDVNHAVIQALGVSLHQVIVDNPEVFTLSLPHGD